MGRHERSILITRKSATKGGVGLYMANPVIRPCRLDQRWPSALRARTRRCDVDFIRIADGVRAAHSRAVDGLGGSSWDGEASGRSKGLYGLPRPL
jgi:hypothetical protein